MIEVAVILLRLAQYGAASILMGSALFVLYALPAAGPRSAEQTRWPRLLVFWAAVVLLGATLAGLVAQTAVMAGSLAEALKPASLEAVVSGMDLGKATAVRAGTAAVAFLLLLRPTPSRIRWTLVASCGVIAAASFAWMGHGAATEGGGGLLHLASDILHSWAAAAWIGALCAFGLLLWGRDESTEALMVSYRALRQFSAVGTMLVATLVVTGLINSWFLVGPENIGGAITTDYGRLLVVKLAFFAGMVILASANRFRLTPQLEARLQNASKNSASVRALRRSLMIETIFGVGVLAAVAWFGTLPPPAAL